MPRIKKATDANGTVFYPVTISEAVWDTDNNKRLSATITDKADKTATVSAVAYDTTNKKITKTINGTTTDVVTVATIKTDLSLSKSDVGLSDVTNDAQVKRSEMGVASGVATLDANGLVPAEQLPSYVDDVVELLAVTDTAPSACSRGDLYYNTTTSKIVRATATDTWGTGSTTNTTPETSKIYIDKSDNKQYRWGGSTLVAIGGAGGAGTIDYTEEEDELDELDSTLATNALRKTSQTLTAGEKTQVRTNLGLDSVYLATSAADGFVQVGQQSLTAGQKTQVRTNLGLDSAYIAAADADNFLSSGQQTLTSGQISQVKENLGLNSSYLMVGTQTLSTSEKNQVRTNLGLDSAYLSASAASGFVSTSAQSLTAGQKAQVKTNLGITEYTASQTRSITFSTSEPTSSDGSDGDIWIVYEEPAS